MSMTRKDFELIAEALKAASLGNLREHRAQFEQCCEEVAKALRSTNPRFDKERFLRACGVEQPA